MRSVLIAHEGWAALGIFGGEALSANTARRRSHTGVHVRDERAASP